MNQKVTSEYFKNLMFYHTYQINKMQLIDASILIKPFQSQHSTGAFPNQFDLARISYSAIKHIITEYILVIFTIKIPRQLHNKRMLPLTYAILFFLLVLLLTRKLVSNAKHRKLLPELPFIGMRIVHLHQNYPSLATYINWVLSLKTL